MANFDETTAAYGLFQAHFAWLADTLAGALFYLQKKRDPNVSVAFDSLIGKTFGQNLTCFKAELEKFPDSLQVHLGLDACTMMLELLKWRNQRIHARVKFDQGALALYSWRTRERLTLNVEEIQQKIARANELVARIESTVESLLNQLDFSNMLKEIFSQIDTAKLD